MKNKCSTRSVSNWISKEKYTINKTPAYCPKVQYDVIDDRTNYCNECLLLK